VTVGNEYPTPATGPVEREFDELLDFLAREVVDEMAADRSSIFLLDGDRHELWSRVALGMGRQIIRFPADRGIAGHVAETGNVLNVPDPYADPRFNQTVDRQTGYRTRSILCGPLRGGDGRTLGVLQVLNKRGGGPFVARDVRRFERLLSRCSHALENAVTYDQLRTAQIHELPRRAGFPKILLAEHDPAVAVQVRELLSDDLEVLQAATAAEIVRMAEAERPDLVLLGVADDGNDAVATCRALRACPAIEDMPIIMLAMPGHPEQVVAAFEAGANDYIVRPFSPAQLRAKTHTWLLRAGNQARWGETQPPRLG
jgi:CheY-like chemotaxis protein